MRLKAVGVRNSSQMSKYTMNSYSLQWQTTRPNTGSWYLWDKGTQERYQKIGRSTGIPLTWAIILLTTKAAQLQYRSWFIQRQWKVDHFSQTIYAKIYIFEFKVHQCVWESISYYISRLILRLLCYSFRQKLFFFKLAPAYFLPFWEIFLFSAPALRFLHLRKLTFWASQAFYFPGTKLREA